MTAKLDGTGPKLVCDDPLGVVLGKKLCARSVSITAPKGMKLLDFSQGCRALSPDILALLLSRAQSLNWSIHNGHTCPSCLEKIESQYPKIFLFTWGHLPRKRATENEEPKKHDKMLL